MADSPSTEELRRIRYLLLWLILVVAANGVYAPGEYGGLTEVGYLVLVVPLFVVPLYFVVKVVDVATTTTPSDDS
ncbi:hypothetical protein [Halobaculum marinum]|uniref:Uncharacterized protein n=1 Tax=Halobaculum marinum TaxID=3031996 RepID=A0ABD5X2W3_9EURY|nr:hypothetical protein [Halobaculum sp. DT55]